MLKNPFVKILLFIFGGALVLFGLIQLVPYGRSHTNPPVVQEPNWSSPEVRALARRACFDCHSNETVYPWYSNIAPVSWLVQYDVETGRSKLNFSDWERSHEDGDKMAEVIEKGEMPPRIYLIQHPEARLTSAEREQLMLGLLALGER